MSTQPADAGMQPNRSSVVDGVMWLSQRVVAVENIIQVSGRFSVDLHSKSSRSAATTIEEPVAFVLEGSSLSVTVGFEFDATIQASVTMMPKGPIDARAAASFVITYKLRLGADEALAEEVLRGFAEINGRFNVIAYWREFLHSSFARAGLPPVYVPPFNAASRIQELRRVGGERTSDPRSSETS